MENSQLILCVSMDSQLINSICTTIVAVLSVHVVREIHKDCVIVAGYLAVALNKSYKALVRIITNRVRQRRGSAAKRDGFPV